MKLQYKYKMTASSSLRQRRSRRDDEENVNNNTKGTKEEDEMELFAKHYKQATANNAAE